MDHFIKFKLLVEFFEGGDFNGRDIEIVMDLLGEEGIESIDATKEQFTI